MTNNQTQDVHPDALHTGLTVSVRLAECDRVELNSDFGVNTFDRAVLTKMCGSI